MILTADVYIAGFWEDNAMGATSAVMVSIRLEGQGEVGVRSHGKE